MNNLDNNQSSVDIFLSKEKEVKQLQQQKKRKKKLIIISIIAVIFLSVLLYLMTDFSRVRAVVINGNNHLSRNEIMEIINIDENSFFLLVFPGTVERRLEENAFIHNATVRRESGRRISVVIEEERIMGYRFTSSGAHIVLFNGAIVPLEEEHLHLLPHIPFIVGFEGPELQERLSRALLALDYDVFQLIAEIHQYQTSFDARMLRIRMQDGNQVFTSLRSIYSVNYYLEVLRALKVSNSCIFVDEISGNLFSQPCPEIEPFVPDYNDDNYNNGDNEGDE